MCILQYDSMREFQNFMTLTDLDYSNSWAYAKISCKTSNYALIVLKQTNKSPPPLPYNFLLGQVYAIFGLKSRQSTSH